MVSIPDLNVTFERPFRLTQALREHTETFFSNQTDVIQGPAELTVMGIVPDLVLTKEAWPHVDAHWKGHVFYTMTADGSMYEFGTPAIPDGIIVAAGKVFRIDPLVLHWLRPDPVVSHTWTALQWVVPVEQEPAFVDALAAAIRAWNEPGFALPILCLAENPFLA
jgi:hypothetical protein